MMGALGDRMKRYETVTQNHLMRRTPAIVRVDGRAFHTLLSRCEKPFDRRVGSAMTDAARGLVSEMQGAKAAYVQSDEASFLLTDYDQLMTEPWFDYNVQKVVSIAASTMSACFAQFFPGASFDARVFSLPEAEVSNYFLWRMKDWERNSVWMYTRSFFSHREMQGKKQADMHEMLHSIGKNWATDLADCWKNGVWLVRQEGGFFWRSDVLPHFANVDAVIQSVLPKEADDAT